MRSKINYLKFYFWLPINKVVGILGSNNKTKLLHAEAVILTRNFRHDHRDSKRAKFITINNTLGYFVIRNMTIDLVASSSAFEKQDMEELKVRIKRKLDQGKRVLFIDAGASFGKYSITLAKFFKNSGSHLKIFAFEPEPLSFSLLTKNVQINNLKNIKAFNLGLSNKSGILTVFKDFDSGYLTSTDLPGTKPQAIKVVKLDSLLSKLPKALEVFIKLDVEGHEIEVLKGAATLSRFSSCTLLVEDCFPGQSTALADYLNHISRFSAKVTPYNSFWTVQ